jgi:hypothetical protein
MSSVLQSYGPYLGAVVLGMVLAKPGACALLLFNAVVKIPGVGQYIAAHPDKAKAWADGFDQAIDAAIDAYSKQDDSQKEPPAAKP